MEYPNDVALDPYHSFVLDRLAGALGEPVQDVVRMMVHQWVADHPDMVASAAASIADFRDRKGAAWRE